MDKQTTEATGQARACFDDLESWVRLKAQEFIQNLLEEEVTDLLGRGKSERKSEAAIDVPVGYRNGHGKPRKFGLTNGTIEVRRPRVRDLEERFESKVLPLFKRQSKQVRDILPELYLHGLSSGDFELAMRGLLGEAAPLSVASITRLKAKWQIEYDEWKKRDLSGLEPVYWWADGLYVKAGIEDRKSALLTIVAALSNGSKIVLALESGERESKESWLKILRDLKARGLKFPRLTIADGHLGLWSALGEIHPQGDEQRCWNHKIVNVLDDIPKKEQAEAAELLKVIPYADTKAECEKRRDEFIARFKKTQTKATETLLRDWDRMTTFYSYPKEHWVHLRTTNIVESPFNVVRLRTDASRRFKKVDNAKAMIWKLLTVAEKAWRKLNAPELMPMVAAGAEFVDGVRKENKNNLTGNQKGCAA
jgi:putative transposase